MTVIGAPWGGAVVAVVAAVADCWVAAVLHSVPAATGDPEVAMELDAVASVRSAFMRADVRTRFEVGSVTKALTGMLLADAIDRRELSMDTTVGEVLPAVAGSEISTVSVRELCTHTSVLRGSASSSLSVRVVTSLRFLANGSFRPSPCLLPR